MKSVGERKRDRYIYREREKEREREREKEREREREKERERESQQPSEHWKTNKSKFASRRLENHIEISKRAQEIPRIRWAPEFELVDILGVYA